MTALALHLAVCPGQRITRLRVIETSLFNSRSLPIRGRVAMGAIVAKAALVRIFVTCCALGRQAHPGAAEILAREQ